MSIPQIIAAELEAQLITSGDHFDGRIDRTTLRHIADHVTAALAAAGIGPTDEHEAGRA